jgi:hypothetical protein
MDMKKSLVSMERLIGCVMKVKIALAENHRFAMTAEGVCFDENHRLVMIAERDCYGGKPPLRNGKS